MSLAVITGSLDTPGFLQGSPRNLAMFRILSLRAQALNAP
jgi:hypothetical protein